MKRILIRNANLFSEKLEYYLTLTVSSKFPGVEMYGVGVDSEKEGFYCVNEVDYEKERIIDFINCLADGLITQENLRDYCEDYTDMLEFRGIIK
ncbi:MAG: hypothetical protein J6A69_01465 [Clostridia bacterium]|nr:hypothetical protein [Clostridia bacterium]